MTLPRQYRAVSQQVDGQAPGRTSLESVVESSRRRSAVSVLVVADDPSERLSLRSILAPLGHTIVEVGSGLEARRCVSRQDFAVILVDIRPPNLDGFELAAFIRSRAESELTPIIFVSTIDRAGHEMAVGYEMGAVDFVLVPIVPAALRAKVALFADLYAKSQELVAQALQLAAAAANSADALAFQLQMLDRMEQLGRAQSDFVSKISHELRSPLASVIGYVELLIDGQPGAEPSREQHRMLSIIERNSRRLLALIEDLLTMSRVEAGTFELEVGPVDLYDVIDRVRDTTSPAMTKAGLELVVDLGSDLKITGDRDQLERALLNLVSNSVKFTTAGGVIEIATRTEGDDIAVSVRHTGSGIPLDEQEQLFTRFFRATRSKEQQVPGTGLGLYIVKQIIELHGGVMRVESSPAGSAFIMLLPICGPPADPLALIRSR